MSVDWSRGDLYHSLTVLMVDPGNLTDVRGELQGITGGSMELHYTGGTKMAASLNSHGPHGWDGTAALRLVHDVSDYTGLLLRETLFTGYVTQVTWQGQEPGPGEQDERDFSWSLSSTLYGLEVSVAENGYAVTSGTKALDMFARICGDQRRKYRIDPTANEHVFSKNRVIDPGTSYLDILVDTCDRSDNKCTVDADGTVAFIGYVRAADRPVDYEVSVRDARGMVIGPIKGEIEGLDDPGRVVVIGDDGESKVIGTAEVDRGDSASFDSRGYRKDNLIQAEDVTPFNNAGARALAERYLKQGSDETPAISHGLMYRPLREGQIELLRMRDGTALRWMISSATLSLTTWTWDLNVKGGYGG